MTTGELNQIDWQLAERFGWTIGTAGIFHDKDGNKITYKRLDGEICYLHAVEWMPSRDISQAIGNCGEGTVVGEMRKKGWFFKAHISCLSDHVAVVFSNPCDPINHRGFEAISEGWPLSKATCQAALEALEIKIEEEAI